MADMWAGIMNMPAQTAAVLEQHLVKLNSIWDGATVIRICDRKKHSQR